MYTLPLTRNPQLQLSMDIFLAFWPLQICYCQMLPPAHMENILWRFSLCQQTSFHLIIWIHAHTMKTTEKEKQVCVFSNLHFKPQIRNFLASVTLRLHSLTFTDNF